MAGSRVFGIFVSSEKLQGFLNQQGVPNEPGEIATHLTTLSGERVAIVYDNNSEPGVYICSEVEPLERVFWKPGPDERNKNVEYYMNKIRSLFPKVADEPLANTPERAAKNESNRAFVDKLPIEVRGGPPGYYNLYESHVYWPGDTNGWSDSEDEMSLSQFTEENKHKMQNMHDHKELDLEKLDELLNTPELVASVAALDKKLVDLRDKKRL